MGSAGCLAGASYCRITPTGDVTPCPYLPTKAGNVRQRGFQKVWATSPALMQLRTPHRQLGGKCGQCTFSQGDDPLCVGCRARAFALAGDVMAADPWCRYQPSEAHGSHKEGWPAPLVAVQKPAEEAQVPWTKEALDRVQQVPFFIRGRVKQAAEAYVRQHSLSQVTPEVLAHLRQRAYGPPSSAGDPPAR